MTFAKYYSVPSIPLWIIAIIVGYICIKHSNNIRAGQHSTNVRRVGSVDHIKRMDSNSI